MYSFQPSLPLASGANLRAAGLSSAVSRPPSIQTSPLMLGEKAAKKKQPRRAASGSGFGKRLINSEFKYTGQLRPGMQSATRLVPDSINPPDYAAKGKPRAKTPKFPWNIVVNSPEEIAKMRVAGRLAREVLDIAGKFVKPGVTTDEIDMIVHAACIDRDAYPSPLNYHGFPKSCCTSVNEIVCHGIPDSTVLVSGDIINVDITLFHDGFHGDCSEMFLVGDVNASGRALVKNTYDCLEQAIAICAPGVAVKKIGAVIESHANAAGFSVVRNFCGHGISSIFHTTPNVLHYKNSDALGIMEAGITFTIEPMIAEGSPKNVTWPDDWTAATSDGKRCAQYEHTLLITADGVEKLTGKLPSSPKYFWET